MKYLSMLTCCLFFFGVLPLVSSVPNYTKSYIVYLGSVPYPNNGDGVAVTNSHIDLISSVLQRNVKAEEIIMQHSYNKVFSGFAASLTEGEAKTLAKHPAVVSMFESQLRQLHTTRSWEFLGLQRNERVDVYSAWKRANFGKDVIIANLDSGVWPESRSFSDEGVGPFPTRYKGICENENDQKFQCNRKLIGARYLYKGFEEYLRQENMSSKHIKSPRDVDGHGTHTLSTAGGNAVPMVSVDGFGNGTAAGGSPGARVAAYKVCWSEAFSDFGGCTDRDILAGFEAAIADNVDVISVSLGGPPQGYMDDGTALGSFHAVMKGIPVVASAGNDGPNMGTVSNVAPWIFTVGASTIDRQFVSRVKLSNKHILKGASGSHMGLPPNKFYPLITGAAAALPRANSTAAGYCLNTTMDPMKVKGKILVCLRGEGNRIDKGYEAKRLGAVGLISANSKEFGIEIRADAHPLPASHLTFADGQALFAYLNSTKSPVATITSGSTDLGVKPAPFMADFSSRGPNSITPGILKPDVTAPGVSIIGAVSEAEEAEVKGTYGLMDGTSMSCPHITGIVGLLKSIYPHWSPSEIKSAIMTTGWDPKSTVLDNVRKPLVNYNKVRATPFDYGAGHVRPNRAMNPGLVYPMEEKDYLNFFCAIGYSETAIKKFFGQSYGCSRPVSVTDVNYPTITVTYFSGNATVTRRVKNVGHPGRYRARVKAPAGVSITIEPKTLKFTKKGQELEYKLVFAAKTRQHLNDDSFGYLVWSDGRHRVRSPIVVSKAH